MLSWHRDRDNRCRALWAKIVKVGMDGRLVSTRPKRSGFRAGPPRGRGRGCTAPCGRSLRGSRSRWSGWWAPGQTRAEEHLILDRWRPDGPSCRMRLFILATFFLIPALIRFSMKACRAICHNRYFVCQLAPWCKEIGEDSPVWHPGLVNAVQVNTEEIRHLESLKNVWKDTATTYLVDHGFCV